MKTPKGNSEKKSRGPKPRELARSRPNKQKAKRKPIAPTPDPTKAKPEEFYAGNAESLIPMVRRALELKGFKFHLWEIGEVLQKEYQLTTAPSEATIWRWCQEAHEAYLADIKALRGREVSDQLQLCDQMLRTWLPRAMGSMNVRRMRMIQGEPTEVIDQSAIEEEVKAAGVVSKFMEKKAKILGIENGMGLPGAEGGEKSVEQLHAFLIHVAAQDTARRASIAKPLKGVTIEVLELESGAEALEIEG